MKARYWLCFVLFCRFACSEKKNAAGPIGASGGALTSTDNAFTLTVPSGALASTIHVSVNAVAAPAGAKGTAYEVQPSGALFEAPVQLKFDYAAMNLHGADPHTLAVAALVNGQWSELADQSRNFDARLLSGASLTAATFALVQSTGTVCIFDTASDSCATLGACANFPGAVQAACADATAKSTETCCFSANTNVCTLVAAANTACDSTGDVCDGVWLGSASTACTGAAEVTCCYAPGTLPISPSPAVGSAMGASAPGNPGNGGTSAGNAGGSTGASSGTSTGIVGGETTGIVGNDTTGGIVGNGTTGGIVGGGTTGIVGGGTTGIVGD